MCPEGGRADEDVRSGWADRERRVCRAGAFCIAGCTRWRDGCQFIGQMFGSIGCRPGQYSGKQERRISQHVDKRTQAVGKRESQI